LRAACWRRFPVQRRRCSSIALCATAGQRQFSAVAGNEVGLFAWLLAGGTGLSALLTANRLLFDAMHLVGAIVLIVLGIQAWRGSRNGQQRAAVPGRGRGPGAAFRGSLVSIAANPKAAAFAISFLPQFLPHNGPMLADLLVLALIQITLDTLWCSAIVLLAGRTSRWLERPRLRQRIERTLETVLLALGFELSLQVR
jgi:threonine/homoserine/homoserine lactone efflux protein